MKTNVTEIFASKVFNEEQMQQRLAKDTLKELQKPNDPRWKAFKY